MTEILRDRGYYERSGGGVTVSGGEPLLQSDFVAELFKACREEGIQTCLESTFYTDWSQAEKVLPFTDLIISDIKHMDPEIHKKYTGVHNGRILENLKRLAEEERELILRIPVIPNVNDDMENIAATADFILHTLGGRVRTLQLLSFMRLGEEKYASLGIPYGIDVYKRQVGKCENCLCIFPGKTCLKGFCPCFRKGSTVLLPAAEDLSIFLRFTGKHFCRLFKRRQSSGVASEAQKIHHAQTVQQSSSASGEILRTAGGKAGGHFQNQIGSVV